MRLEDISFKKPKDKSKVSQTSLIDYKDELEMSYDELLELKEYKG